MSTRTKIQILCDNRAAWLSMEKYKSRPADRPAHWIAVREAERRAMGNMSIDTRFGYYGMSNANS